MQENKYLAYSRLSLNKNKQTKGINILSTA